MAMGCVCCSETFSHQRILSPKKKRPQEACPEAALSWLEYPSRDWDGARKPITQPLLSD